MLANHDQNILVLFRLAQSMCFYIKLESSYCRIYFVNMLGSINRELNSIDRKSCRLFFLQNFQLSPSPFNVYKKKNPSHVLGDSSCYACKSFVRSRCSCLHTYLGLSRTRLCQELDDRFSCYFKSLKIYKRECLCLLGIQEKSNLWTRSCHVVMVISFLLEVAIGC